MQTSSSSTASTGTNGSHCLIKYTATSCLYGSVSIHWYHRHHDHCTMTAVYHCTITVLMHWYHASHNTITVHNVEHSSCWAFIAVSILLSIYRIITGAPATRWFRCDDGVSMHCGMPSLYHHCTITAPSLHRYALWHDITLPTRRLDTLMLPSHAHEAASARQVKISALWRRLQQPFRSGTGYHDPGGSADSTSVKWPVLNQPIRGNVSGTGSAAGRSDNAAGSGTVGRRILDEGVDTEGAALVPHPVTASSSCSSCTITVPSLHHHGVITAGRAGRPVPAAL